MPNMLRTSFAIGAALLFGSVSVSDAFARDFKRSGSYKTGKGKTGTYQSQSSRGDGKVTRHQSVTTQDGKTYNREVTGRYNKDTGTLDRSVTNPKGNTRTVTEKAGADGTRTGSYITSGGKTGTTTGKTVRNADGSVTRSGSATTESGKTLNRSATSSYDKNTGTVNRTVTGPGGGTRSTTSSYDKNTGTVNKTLTGPGGGTATIQRNSGQ